MSAMPSTVTGSGAAYSSIRTPRARRSASAARMSCTRQAILEAARAEFGARGFDHATIREIAARAGVDPALVHHYFGAKDHLFEAALVLPADPAALFSKLALAGLMLIYVILCVRSFIAARRSGKV